MDLQTWLDNLETLDYEQRNMIFDALCEVYEVPNDLYIKDWIEVLPALKAINIMIKNGALNSTWKGLTGGR